MTPAFFRLEVLRLIRTRRILIFSVAFPVMIFLLSAAGSSGDRLGGFTVVTYVLVSMLAYACTTALLSGGARIAIERQLGWNRQLRIAGVSGRTYLATKLLLAYLATVPGVMALLVVGRIRGAHLGGLRWAEVPLAILLCLAPVAALGVLVGYLVTPDSMQQVIGLGSVVLAFSGGQFIPATQFSTGVLTFVKLLPSYWSTEVGRDVLRDRWIGAQGCVVLVAWTVIFAALAARFYARDSQK